MRTVQSIQTHYGVHLLTSEVPANMEVVSCFGLVYGQAIVGANFIKDFFARVSDVTGGRVSGYESALNGATLDAFELLTKRAADLGANAVVAITNRASAMGPRMLMATCEGTAFFLQDKRALEERRTIAEPPPQYLHPEPLG